MAIERVVRNQELNELGMGPKRLEVPVSSEILRQLKAFYGAKTRGCKIIFSNTEELLVALPKPLAEILYYRQEAPK